MVKTIYSRRQELLRQALIDLRHKAGLNQRQLAERLGRERSLVGRLELGERRVDLAEFFSICEACGADPVPVETRLLILFKAIPAGTGKAGRIQRSAPTKL